MDLNLIRKMAGIPSEESKSVRANSQANELRRLAGLDPLPIKEEPKEEPGDEMTSKKHHDEEEDHEEHHDEKHKKHHDEEDHEEELPDIVSKVAAQAEGMTGDDLVELIKKVYYAGMADGAAKETPEEE